MQVKWYHSEIVELKISIKILFTYLFLISAAIISSSCNKKTEDILSVEERQWINELDGELIHAPDPFTPPMEFFDTDGVFKGMTADYLDIISERLNIKIKTIKVKSWAEVIEKAKNREIHFSTAVQKTVPREEF